MITLHGFAHRLPELAMGHTRDLRVQWALEEVGLPYRVRGLDLLAGELKREEFGHLSPTVVVVGIVLGA